jgi:hypothetical protein
MCLRTVLGQYALWAKIEKEAIVSLGQDLQNPLSNELLYG